MVLHLISAALFITKTSCVHIEYFCDARKQLFMKLKAEMNIGDF